MKRIISILALAMVALLHGAAGQTDNRIVLLAAGDAMTHQAIIRCAKRNDRGATNNNGFNYQFEYLRPYVSSADIATVNAEFPIPAKLRHGRVQYVFGAPPAEANAIAWAGFDVANLANNHALDQGIPGIVETIEAFENAGVKTVGSGRNAVEAERPVVIEHKGMEVAFLAASRILKRSADTGDSKPRVNYLEIERIIHWIAEARKAADVVVVHVHWSAEGRSQPADGDKRDAIRMMEAGADLVIGHHPHVLQPVLEYTASDGRKCLAAMSLGNLISNQRPGYRYGATNQRYGDPRDGALLRVSFERREGRIVMSGWDAVPLWTWNDRLDPSNKVKYPWNIQVWPIKDAIERINSELAQTNVSPAKRRYLVTMRNDLTKRSENILRHLGIPL